MHKEVLFKAKQGQKKYAVKYAELYENKETGGDMICTMEHELKMGLYLNNSKFIDSQNIIFSKKYGNDNIVKYYPLKVAKLNPDVIDKVLSGTKNNDENIERLKTGQDTGCYIVSEVYNEGGLDSFLKKPDNFEKFVLDFKNFEDMIYQIFCELVFFTIWDYTIGTSNL